MNLFKAIVPEVDRKLTIDPVDYHKGREDWHRERADAHSEPMDHLHYLHTDAANKHSIAKKLYQSGNPKAEAAGKEAKAASDKTVAALGHMDKGKPDKSPWTIYSHAYDVPKKQMGKGLKSSALHELHHPRTATQTRAAIDHLKDHKDFHTPEEQQALEERVRRAAKKHGISLAATKSPEAYRRTLERKARMAQKALDSIVELQKAVSHATLGGDVAPSTNPTGGIRRALPSLEEEGELRSGAHRTPPKEYRETGATEAEHYASPREHKYPVHTEENTRAAISYFSKPKNYGVYSPDEQKSIWARIKKAAKKFKIELSDASGPPSVQKSFKAADVEAMREQVMGPLGRYPGFKFSESNQDLMDRFDDLMRTAKSVEGEDEEKGYALGEAPPTTRSGTPLYIRPQDVSSLPKKKKERVVDVSTAPQFAGGGVSKSAEDEGYDTVSHKQIHTDLDKHPDKAAAIRRAAHYHSAMALAHMNDAEHASPHDQKIHYAAAKAHWDAQHDFHAAHEAHMGNTTWGSPAEMLDRAKNSSHAANGHSVWSAGGSSKRMQRVPEFEESKVSKAMKASSMPRIPRALMFDTYRSATAVLTRNHSAIAKDVSSLHTGPLTAETIKELQEEEYNRTQRTPVYKSCEGCGRTYMVKSMNDPCPTCSVNKSHYCSKCKSHLIKSNGGNTVCPLCG